jgi:signal peptidase I
LGETLFVKRLVGLPGDRIAFKNKQLIINGVPLLQTGQHPYTLDDGREVLAAHENLLGIGHTILQDPAREGQDVAEVVVPPDHFVMMGDNRDNSIDGRFWSWPAWGFVPRADLMGRAEFIFWSWNDAWQPRLERFGTSLRAQPQAGTESSQPTPTAPPQVLNQARGGMAG